MKKIVNDIIPFAGYKAMMIWPFLFIRRKAVGRFTEADERHERIHGEQQKEMLIVPFYLWYIIEWLVRLVQYGNGKTAYKNISFEREAYDKEGETGYVDGRERFAWLRYLKTGNAILHG